MFCRDARFARPYDIHSVQSPIALVFSLPYSMNMARKIVTTIRLDPVAKASLKRLAKRLRVSLSALIEALIWAAVRGDIVIEPMKIRQVRPIMIYPRKSRHGI